MSTFSKSSAGINSRAADDSKRHQPASRILLVEGNRHLRWLMTNWLANSGFQVDAAPDIMAGWEAIRLHRYDLLIANHNPPHLSGLELINWLRSAQMIMPAILLSEKLKPEELNQEHSAEVQWFQLLQFTAVLKKPFTTDELMASVIESLNPVSQLQPRNGDAVPARDKSPAKESRNGTPHPAPAGWETGQQFGVTA